MATEYRPPARRLNQEIANAIVRGRKRGMGRGPTKAQAFFHHNVVVVVMQDALTEAERTLAGGGEGVSVLEMRLRFQQSLRHDLVEAIQQLTGCKVEAFMSSNHIDPDLSAELFILDRAVDVEPSSFRPQAPPPG